MHDFVFLVGVALGIAFAYGWELTLLTLAFVPFIVFAGILQLRLITGHVSRHLQQKY